MALPIPMEIPPRDPKRELLARLEAAPAEHAAALLDSYELLQALHDHGVLTLARGVLGASTKIVATASETAETPEAIRAMRNAILLGKLLGSIDPELLAGVTAAAGESFGNVKTLPANPPGLLATLHTLAGRDARMIAGWIGLFMARLTPHLRARTNGTKG
jgi:uncharacterized protein YjgD (DUF1641 family)